MIQAASVCCKIKEIIISVMMKNEHVQLVVQDGRNPEVAIENIK